MLPRLPRPARRRMRSAARSVAGAVSPAVVPAAPLSPPLLVKLPSPSLPAPCPGAGGPGSKPLCAGPGLSRSRFPARSRCSAELPPREGSVFLRLHTARLALRAHPDLGPGMLCPSRIAPPNLLCQRSLCRGCPSPPGRQDLEREFHSDCTPDLFVPLCIDLVRQPWLSHTSPFPTISI